VSQLAPLCFLEKFKMPKFLLIVAKTACWDLSKILVLENKRELAKLLTMTFVCRLTSFIILAHATEDEKNWNLQQNQPILIKLTTVFISVPFYSLIGVRRN
jgi:hypothetical protein